MYVKYKKVIKNRFIIAIHIFLLCAIQSFASKNILFLHSYHAEHNWTNYLLDGINESFKNYGGVTLFHEYLDAKRYPKTNFKSSYAMYLNEKYKNTAIDVLVTTDNPALTIIREYREQLFPDTPIIYMGINQVTQELMHASGMTGVFENTDLSQAIFDIKKLTGKDEIIIISEKTETGMANMNKVKIASHNIYAPGKIHYIEEISDEEIPIVFEKYDSDIPIFQVGQIVSKSNNGGLISWKDGAQLLTDLLPNPLFNLVVASLDYGTVGAYQLSGDVHAKQASKIIKLVLEGASVDSIEPIRKSDAIWVFDWNKLKKLNIEENNIPSHSIMLNKEKSFYNRYKLLVWIIIVLFLVIIIIIFMLLEIIRRGNRANDLLVENERRYIDLADASSIIFWETNKNIEVNYVSGNSNNMLPIEEENIKGRKLEDIFGSLLNIEFPLNKLQSLLNNKKYISNLQFQVKSRNGENDLQIFILNGKPIYDSKNNFLGYRGICKEITAEFLLSRELAYLAEYDTITGLINRNSFNENLRNIISEDLEKEKNFICSLSLDRFKLVSETAGHLVGDAMIKEISNILKNAVDRYDILARLSRDEFGIIIQDKSIEEARNICQTIIQNINSFKFKWTNKYLNVGISVGLISINSDLNDTELVSKANLACQKSKETGRGSLYVANYDYSDLYDEEIQRGYIANVTQSLEENRFFLVRQLITTAIKDNENYKHYEILVRYRDVDGSLVPPYLFIPAAEKHGVIEMIDFWIVKTVLTRYEEFFPENNSMVSINLSGISLSSENFVTKIKKLIHQVKLKPENICFEITETAVISQLSRALKFINEMKGLGVKFALDDFGSGSSSFGYLKEIPVDYLKIDGSLIKNIVSEPYDRAIVESVNKIAHMMGMKTIAEFVENDDIRSLLIELGVDFVQGYGIGKPEEFYTHNNISKK